ncbi:MAG: hypothetical protein IPI67_35800 [Myxococcales bacterium]|nr:hypothetical protein [Myxococcales bacterium]
MQRELCGVRLEGKSGAVTVVQRVFVGFAAEPAPGFALPDGVYAESAGGEIVFHPLPFLTSDDVGGG